MKVLFGIFVMLLMSASAFDQPTESKARPQMPSGWGKMGLEPQNYEMYQDISVKHSGPSR